MQDGKLYCDWCLEEVEPEQAWEISWFRPKAKEPYLALNNVICPGCQQEMHEAVAGIEQRRRSARVG